MQSFFFFFTFLGWLRSGGVLSVGVEEAEEEGDVEEEEDEEHM